MWQLAIAFVFFALALCVHPAFLPAAGAWLALGVAELSWRKGRP